MLFIGHVTVSSVQLSFSILLSGLRRRSNLAAGPRAQSWEVEMVQTQICVFPSVSERGQVGTGVPMRM